MRIHTLVWDLVVVECSQKHKPKRIRDKINAEFRDVTVNFNNGIVNIRSTSGGSCMVLKTEKISGYGGFSMSYGKATLHEMTPWSFIMKAHYLDSNDNFVPVDIIGTFQSDTY